MITNLDEHSPPEFVHLDNLIDIGQTTELPLDRRRSRRSARRAQETARERGWTSSSTGCARSREDQVPVRVRADCELVRVDEPLEQLCGQHLQLTDARSNDSAVRSSPFSEWSNSARTMKRVPSCLLTLAGVEPVVIGLAGELEVDVLERQQALREARALRRRGRLRPRPPARLDRLQPLAGKQELRLALGAADDIGVEVEELPAAAPRARLGGPISCVGELDPDQLSGISGRARCAQPCPSSRPARRPSRGPGRVREVLLPLQPVGAAVRPADQSTPRSSGSVAGQRPGANSNELLVVVSSGVRDQRPVRRSGS